MSLFAAAIVALNFVFLAQHVTKYGGQLKSLLEPVWAFLWAFPLRRKDDRPARAEVEKAVWDVRARTYRHAIQFLIHQNAFVLIGMSYNLYREPSFTHVAQLCILMGVYLHAVSCEKMNLNAKNLRFLYVLFYSAFSLFIIASVWQKDTEARAVSKQVFNMSSRMIMSLIFIDTWTTGPAQVVISTAEIWQYSVQHDIADTVLFAWVQILAGSGIVAFSVILEYWITCHVSSLLDTESILSSFRRMLRGVCDGEVLLADDMTIRADAECLKHLLMNSGNFKGKSFEKLLQPAEVTRFRDFMKQSQRDALQPDEQRTRTPPCLRISLRGASDIRVGVDLWHVPMCGKDGALHLLALREDAEAQREPPQCEEPHPRLPVSPQSNAEADSLSESMSQNSSGSLLQSFPELSDMTLCVDTSSRWFDVEQAHLSFVRQPQSSDMSMPSLRRLVRPTDWETVRSKLKEVAEGGESETLRLRLLDDAKRSLIAQVQVSAYRPPRGSEDGVKLCLNFTDLVFDEKAPGSARHSLGSIEE
ncbi:unnamed protein product [Durusdinium trenchii]|uniref:Uncharacterized protein n=2 Tax=Durusdinium trenchii TaxID=1381693 RepID=A0ABP0MC81_9DINO